MTDSSVSKSSGIPGPSSCVNTHGDSSYQSDYRPQKEYFVDPSTSLFSNEFLFESNFEAFDSPPIQPELSENAVAPPSSCDTCAPPSCRNCYKCMSMSSNACVANIPDHFTPSLSPSNPVHCHGRVSQSCLCNINATFAPPTQCKSLYQDIPPPRFHHYHHPFDAASRSFTNSSVIHPDNFQGGHKTRKINSCPNSPATKQKQAYRKSMDTEEINTGQATKRNTDFPHHSDCPQHSDLCQELGCNDGVEAGSGFSQSSSAFPDDESLCATQLSSTQASTFSEEAHSLAELSPHLQLGSPLGNDRYNFSPGLEKSPLEKTKVSNKRKTINERERNRARNMNMAFRELGDACASITNERPNTKLATLHQALSLLNKIDSLKPGEKLSSFSDKD